MLGTLRENKNSTIISFVVGLIVLAFMFWGPSLNRGKKNVVLARVNGEMISPSQFGRAVGNQLDTLRRRYQREIGEQEQKLIKQQVLDRMIQQRLLLQEAERLGIIVSDEELRSRILQLPYLKDEDGKFDIKRWKRFKRRNPSFEQNQRESMQIDRLLQYVQNAVDVSDADLQDLYREQNTKIDLEFVKLSCAAFENDVDISQADRDAYFEAHEAEVRKRYDDDFERLYNIPKKVKASHILLKYSEDDSDALRAELRKRMEAIREQVLTGDFADLARRYSEDPGSATRGGSLGYFEKDRMDPAFANAAFSTPVGQISDIVESRFGLHIIKVEDIQEAQVKTFEEVKNDIIDKMIKKEKAPALCEDAANKLKAAWPSAGPALQALLDDYHLSIQETGLVARRGDTIPRIGTSAELADAAFALRPGTPAPDTVYTVGNAKVLIRLKSRQDADMAKFEQEKETLRRQALMQKQSRVLDAWIDELKARAEIDINPHLDFLA